MAGDTIQTPKIVDLADRLVSDIKARRLKAGDRYLTTAEAARLLGVGTNAANRALQLLQRRRVITRQQRRGAYIAEFPQESLAALRRVRLLVHSEYMVMEGVTNDLMILGMQGQLPGVDIQIQFLPEENLAGFATGLIEQTLGSKELEGFVLVRAPYEVHQVFSNSGVSCVVFGGLFPGISRLCRFDRDMGAVGHIAADYLLARGHQRMVFLSRQHALPGDHLTVESFRDRLAAAGFLAGTAKERFLPRDPVVCEAEVHRLLSLKRPPTAFICRKQMFADTVKKVAATRQLEVGKDLDIFLCDYYLMSGQIPQYVYPRPVYTPEHQGQILAQVLSALALNRQVPDRVIPVELDDSAHPYP